VILGYLQGGLLSLIAGSFELFFAPTKEPSLEYPWVIACLENVSFFY